ncbi:MAG TPA: DUF3307 domain-containing protein [Bacteroidia bacterium]|nr:DUF3307 domain-containing protein [Bacteroidia bacterium]HRD40920.1 DUF3307 domain-containing protein [Bacteroidia bacterium]
MGIINPVSTILIIFIVHFLADFVFQTSQMATGKSKSLKWLSIHVGVYALVSLISFVIVAKFLDNYYMAFAWWIGNVALHFVTDFITSKITSKFWESKNYRFFFVMIGLDQLIHNLCLVGTLYAVKTFIHMI